MTKESQETATAPEFSAVISCYFEEQSIDEFYTRLSKALASLGRSYEIIFVNDGSTDATFEKLKAIYDKDPRVTAIIDLFKNSGQGAGVTAGLNHARGQHFILMDSDLQLEPEELPRLVAKFDEGYDVVSGYREKRKDSLLRIIPSKLANAIMRRVSKSTLRDFGCTFKIYNGRLVRAFNYGPLKTFNQVNVIAHVERIAEVPVSHHPRKYGKSGWTFRKLLVFNMENIVRLSEKPFQVLAALCLLLAFAFVLRIVVGILFPFSIMGEVTPALILYAIVIGFFVTISVLAAIGEFVIRNFVSLQRTPAYIIREICTK